jgi:hypothetical protein
MLLAKPVKFPSAADALNARIQPKRHQDLGIHCRPARMLFPSQNRIVERLQINSLGKTPHHPSRVIGWQQRLQITRVELNLRAIGCFQSRLSTDFFWQSFWRLNIAKQFFLHERTLLA